MKTMVIFNLAFELLLIFEFFERLKFLTSMGRRLYTLICAMFFFAYLSK